MKRRRLFTRFIILAILLGAIGYTLYSNFFVDKERVLKGKQAIDFSIVDLNGQEHQISSLKGKGVMLNFFGTWCKPCEKEMPLMNKLYQTYKDKGIEILAIDNDEADLVVETYVARMGLTFPVAIDQTGEAFSKYNIGPLPTSIFINKDGVVVDIVTGELTEELLTSLLDKTIQ
ncbi:MAG: thiol-disulfide oxidoreductase ResA [Bacillaceae bacterium]